MRRTASALIASSASRLAAIAVVSAWSYGGDTSTMSIATRSTAPTILADGPQQLARQQAPGSGVPVSRRQARIEHVDVDRQVDGVRPVERLGDRVGDDGLRAPLLDLGHEVVAQAVLAHPLEVSTGGQ